MQTFWDQRRMLAAAGDAWSKLIWASTPDRFEQKMPNPNF